MSRPARRLDTRLLLVARFYNGWFVLRGLSASSPSSRLCCALPLRPTQLTPSIRGASRCSLPASFSAGSQLVEDVCAKTVSVSSVQGGREEKKQT